MGKSADSGKYILENNLRTWSELKRERIAAAAAKAQALPSSTPPSIVTTTASTPTSEKDKEKEAKLGSAGAASPSSTPARKKWGGCPNGCDHSKHYYKKENSMHAMQLNGRPAATESLISRRPAARRWQSSSEEDDDIRGRINTNTNNPSIDVGKSLEETVSSPDGTPSFISVEDRLRNRLKSPNDLLHLVRGQGRDFGGSASGKSSIAGSDTEFSAEEDAKKKAARGKGLLPGRTAVSLGGSRGGRVQSGMGRGALADALGDQSDVGSDAGPESESDEGAEPSPALQKVELVREGNGVSGLEDLEKAEKEDKSIKGSVY